MQLTEVKSCGLARRVQQFKGQIKGLIIIMIEPGIELGRERNENTFRCERQKNSGRTHALYQRIDQVGSQWE